MTSDDAVRPRDPGVIALLDAVRASGIPAIHEASVEESRERIRAMRAAAPRGPEVAAVDTFSVSTPWGGVPVRSYRPDDAGQGLVVYLHGGGWVLGGLDESDSICRHLAAETGQEVVSVGYRLAPEHPFPAAVHDTDAVLAWLATDYAVGRPLALLGDSAGATLAAVAVRHALEKGAHDVRLLALVYPVVDAQMATDSFRRFDVDGLLLASADMRWFWDHYIPDAAERSHPDARLTGLESLAGLPPVLIVLAGFDPLHDEGADLASRIEEAGKSVLLKDYPEMIHGFFPMFGTLPDAADAMGVVVEEIRAALSR